MNEDRADARSILVVDDEEPIRKLLVAMLAARNHACVAVGSVADAVRQMSRRRFDLVLLDLALPDVGGERLLDSMRASHQDTPVLVITGMGERRQLDARRRGAADVLLKPFTARELLRRVDQCLGCETRGSR